MDDYENILATFAFSSRLFILVLQFLANLAIPDHDAVVFNPPVDNSQFSLLDHAIHTAFGGLRRWDAVYFTHIMEYGYTYENCVAFFPFYPLVVFTGASAFNMLGLLQFSSWILLVAVFINLALFMLTVRALYRLGRKILGREDIAYYAALFFCINPASIFMTAPYSEIMYTFLLVHALLLLNSESPILAVLLISLSFFTRSNGMVGVGFILYAIAKTFVTKGSRILDTIDKVKPHKFFIASLWLFLTTVIKTAMCLIIAPTPFLMYQFYTFYKFCVSGDPMPAFLVNYGRAQGYHLEGDKPSSWCNDSIPLSYTYIQKHHWGVGFLTYYEVKQLPNFLLAFPVLLLSIRTCLYFFKLSPREFYTLGLLGDISRPVLKEHDIRAGSGKQVDASNKDGTWTQETDATGEDKEVECNIPSGKVVVYIIHLMALTIFGCCFIHIQVLTRLLLSSSPLLYWYCGVVFAENNQRNTVNRTKKEIAKNCDILLYTKQTSGLSSPLQWILETFRLHFISYFISNWNKYNFECRMIFLYFVTYSFLGTIMFSNFLPWT